MSRGGIRGRADRDLGGLGEAESCREEEQGPWGRLLLPPDGRLLTISAMAALEC